MVDDIYEIAVTGELALLDYLDMVEKSSEEI